MMPAHDVAVIGAGPAGSVAALVLARAGLDVVLIGPEPRDDVGRGETLSVATAPLLARLGLSDIIDLRRMPPVTGFVSRWGSARESVRPAFLVPDAPCVSLDRRVFDAALAAAAALCGTAIVPDRVRSFSRAGAHWRMTLCDGRQRAAHLVIDATGRGARFARRAGIDLRALDRLIAVTAVLPVAAEDHDRTVVVEATPHGWVFTTLDPRGRRVVSFFTDRDLWPASDLREPGCLLARILAESHGIGRNARFASQCAIRIWPAGTLVLDRAVGQGILAVGDAAQTSDPISSQGIAAAMDDAAEAARLIAVGFDRGLLSMTAEHEERHQTRMIRYLVRRAAYYGLETRWPENAFWRRRRTNPFDSSALQRAASRA